MFKLFRTFCRNVFRKKQVDQELEEEIRSYVELVASEKERGGISHEEALRQARRELGGNEQVKESVRDIRSGVFLDRLTQDLRYALRNLKKNPGFSTVIVLTLALGIGANTTIFSLINAVLVHSLPVQNPDQLVLFGAAEGNFGGNFAQLGAWGAYSVPLYRQFKNQNRYFQDLSAFQSYTSSVSVRYGGLPARVALVKAVSGNYFSVFGVRPLLGRTLFPEDDQLGHGQTAVMSYRVWTRLFSRDPQVVGRAVNLNGTPITIVGVMPEEFFGEKIEPQPADFWLPLDMQPVIMSQSSYLNDPEMHWLNIMGRLKPGTNPVQAQAQLTHRLQQFIRAQAGTPLTSETEKRIRACHIELTPGGRGISKLRDRFSVPLHILLGLVATLLLAACVNVASLLLTRSDGRKQEIAMRLILGAKRGRLIRQLLTESALLAALGGAVGVAMSWWGTEVLTQFLSQGGERLPLTTGIDFPILAFTVCAVFTAALAFGLLPALQTTRVDLGPALKMGTANVGPRLPKVYLGVSEVMVILQLAFSIVLLTAGSLLIRSFANLKFQDLGFNRDSVLMVSLDERLAGYQANQLAALNRQIEERINSLPGVKSASLAKNSLLGTDIMGGDIGVQGYSPRQGEDMTIEVNMVGPKYFETEGMRLLNGRPFAYKDIGRKPAVAVINESMAKRFFPNQNPIGKVFSFGSPNEIVGVVKDARYNSLKGEVPAMAYLPLTHYFANDLEVRTIGEPTAITSQVRQALAQIDPAIPILKITTLTRQVDDSLAQERLVADLAAFFSFCSLVLSSIGLYGILSSFVNRSRKELGIRLALGAPPAGVLWMVLQRTLSLIIGGTFIGLALGAWTNKLISSQLFGLEAHDFVTIALSVGLLVMVGVCSSLFPAKRAAGIDPMEALRYE